MYTSAHKWLYGLLGCDIHLTYPTPYKATKIWMYLLHVGLIYFIIVDVYEIRYTTEEYHATMPRYLQWLPGIIETICLGYVVNLLKTHLRFILKYIKIWKYDSHNHTLLCNKDIDFISSSFFLLFCIQSFVYNKNQY